MPFGNLKLAGTPATPIAGGVAIGLAAAKLPPGVPGSCCPTVFIEFDDGGCERTMDGVPDLPSRKFLRRSAMSGGALMPPLLENVGCGTGLRAALTLPRGVEEVVMPAVVGASAEARGGRRGG